MRDECLATPTHPKRRFPPSGPSSSELWTLRRTRKAELIARPLLRPELEESHSWDGLKGK